MQAVELDADGCFLHRFPLKGEAPATQWVNGICVLLPEGSEPAAGDSVAALQQRVCTASDSMWLWHAEGLSAGGGTAEPAVRWTRLL